MATAAVFLATKIDENARKMKDVVIQCYALSTSGVRIDPTSEVRIYVSFLIVSHRYNAF